MDVVEKAKAWVESSGHHTCRTLVEPALLEAAMGHIEALIAEVERLREIEWRMKGLEK